MWLVRGNKIKLLIQLEVFVKWCSIYYSVEVCFCCSIEQCDTICQIKIQRIKPIGQVIGQEIAKPNRSNMQQDFGKTMIVFNVKTCLRNILLLFIHLQIQ